MNSTGTIDADYGGEICIILINLSDEEFIIKDGDSICQMIIGRYRRISCEDIEILVETKRGAGGFGHTGKE